MLNSLEDASQPAYFSQLNSSVMKLLLSMIAAAVTSMILANLYIYISACDGLACDIAERSDYSANILSLNRKFNCLLISGVLLNIKSMIFLFADLVWRLYVKNWVLAAAMSGLIIVFFIICSFITISHESIQKLQ